MLHILSVTLIVHWRPHDYCQAYVLLTPLLTGDVYLLHLTVVKEYLMLLSHDRPSDDAIGIDIYWLLMI